ncbi:glycosyltransferase family 2 protein [Enterococcus italicus]|uniref:Glycosyltransferase, group 2 family protein n=1 Tax=Enterococcus italicus (strain DSM 15952 / CCUG 50447 / LMG 22039 / TP 1.5) TaxID=888064 RepID=E6LFH6_ENTI1|nr:glycosyltransferase family 2 protein [Enterococcus italicus]EFU74046.1 glycosyltransferase, group 2 family protein [Enterococcus italicus DSM 15952]OJG60892.1 cell wall biosynthesis glycosyltransferase [Enterococcus italicus DSM 15952]
MDNNKEKQIQISVIVPVYNAENFINRCIDSILKNTFNNFELLIIDDGSSDKSLEKIKLIRDERIRYFSQQNHGVAYTRNRGIKEAKGKFVVFIDSDDYVKPDYLEKLLEGIGDSDIGISGIVFLDSEENIVNIRNSKNTEWNRFNLPLSGGKIYNRKFLISNHILFSDFIIGEDLIFSSTCYSKTNRVSNILYMGYNYVENFQSSTHKNYRDLNVISIVSELKRLLEQNSSLKKEFIIFFLRKTLIDLTFYTYDNNREKSLIILNEGYSLIKGKVVLFNKNETIKMNIFVNLTSIMVKLKLGFIPLYLMRKLRGRS